MKPSKPNASRDKGPRLVTQGLAGVCAAVLLLIVSAIMQASGQASGQIGPKRESRHVETVASGIEHIEIKRGDFSAESDADRWTIHALIVAPGRARLRLAQAMNEIVGAETTSAMAVRHGALAAINGGYFRTSGEARGEPIGALAISGRLLSESVKRRAALALADDGKITRAVIALVDTKAQLTLGGKPVRAINGINRPRGNNELILFTPEFHRTTLTRVEGAKPAGVEVVVINHRVATVRDNLGDTAIPRNGFVISASGAAASWARMQLRRGANVEIKTEINAYPAIPFKPDFIIGGGPRLLSAGSFVANREAASYAASFYRTRHPRTAFGWRADGKFVLVTVDGRQRDSVGMTIEELAVLMRELGCREAINFDGGGSTTMVIRNRIVNHPSDLIGERPVSDALLVVGR